MQKLPAIAVRDLVIFPGTMVHILIGREKSIKSLVLGQKTSDPSVVFVAQKHQEDNDPKSDDLHGVGVIVKIVQMIRLPNNTIQLIVEGITRVKIASIDTSGEYIMCECSVMPDNIIPDPDELSGLTHKLHEKFGEYIKMNRRISPDVLGSLILQNNPDHLVNTMVSHMVCKTSHKQDLLEMCDVKAKMEYLLHVLESEISIIQVEQSVHTRVKQQIEKTHRDYYLHEQIKAIQKELNDGSEKSDIQNFESKIQSLHLSQEAKDKAESELKRLKSMGGSSTEASVIRSYLEVLLGLPWTEKTKDFKKVDIQEARSILDQDHHGLEKVKERILEHIGVLQRTKKISGSIICLVGPPGVGKTSLAKSIAKALKRKYFQFALGGMRDESEIRGHRRTYLGSMPGRILSGIKRVESDSPVILLDEIDKMGMDVRGDPASALLEVLDPEQNENFIDHYLEVKYSLRKVFFMCTANFEGKIPLALRDRMEIIRIEGYTESEKMKICEQYLISKQTQEHGLHKGELVITQDAMRRIIRNYTRESGVRSLEKCIAKICRKVLMNLLSNKKIKSFTVDADDLVTYLGVHQYDPDQQADENGIGITNGLAYNEVGGSVIHVEAVRVPGKGEIRSTGQLGDVMKESTQAAYSFFCSKIKDFGLSEDECKKTDLHLHFPSGATPKDGPSAGIAIFTTIVSVSTGIPVKKDVAMTGEITIRGKVLPIGGLKEKLMAATRCGINTVVIPEENVKDLKEIPDDVKQYLDIIPIKTAEQVLDIALAK